jgi:hypothetical protein
VDRRRSVCGLGGRGGSEGRDESVLMLKVELEDVVLYERWRDIAWVRIRDCQVIIVFVLTDLTGGNCRVEEC